MNRSKVLQHLISAYNNALKGSAYVMAMVLRAITKFKALCALEDAFGRDRSVLWA